jgi:hypothetical protein
MREYYFRYTEKKHFVSEAKRASIFFSLRSMIILIIDYDMSLSLDAMSI